MNIVYYYNLTAHNAWRWRFEIHTADGTELSAPQYVALPDKCIAEEIIWQAKYEKLPLGISDTPSLTLTFDVRSLSASPELGHLQTRLFKPFVKYDLPPQSYQTGEQQYYDPETEQWVTIPPETVSIAPRVKSVKLSNVVRVKCDFGNQNDTNFFSNPIANEDSDNGSLVFSGVQRIAPEPEYDLQTGGMTIEFMHLTRYALEQVNYTIVQNYFAASVTPPIRTKFVVLATSIKSGQILEIRETIEGATEQGAFGTYNGIELARLETLMESIQEPFELIRNKVLRQTTSTWYDFPLSNIQFSRFYKQQISGIQGTAVGTSGLLFISRIYDAFADENGNRPIVGGTFSEGSAFAKYKNMFDFLVDFYNSGVKVVYRDAQFVQGNLQSGLNTGTPPQITEENIELNKLVAQADCVASVEVVAGGKNTILSDFGTALVDTTANVFSYFHLGYADFSFQESDAENSLNFGVAEIPSPIIDAYSFNLATPEYEGRLFYQDGAYVRAVHPACDFADNGTFINDAFSANAAMPPSMVTLARKRDWETLDEQVNKYLQFWQRDFGIANHVGRSILRHFTFDEQKRIEGKIQVQGLYTGSGGSTNIFLPLPANIGFLYQRSTTLLESFTNTPTARTFLTSSSMNIVTGVAEVSFHALPNPVNIIPL